MGFELTTVTVTKFETTNEAMRSIDTDIKFKAANVEMCNISRFAASLVETLTALIDAYVSANSVVFALSVTVNSSVATSHIMHPMAWVKMNTNYRVILLHVYVVCF